MGNEYDPWQFRQAIETLEYGEAGDSRDRKYILESMREDLEYMAGNVHKDLLRYIAELSLFPDDPVDFNKLNLLHYEFAVSWGSTMAWELGEEEKKRALARLSKLPNQRKATAAKIDKAKEREDAIHVWVDKHLRQRQYKSPPQATDLARRLLRNSSGFQWPEGCKPIAPETVEKIIRAYLKGDNHT